MAKESPYGSLEHFAKYLNDEPTMYAKDEAGQSLRVGVEKVEITKLAETARGGLIDQVIAVRDLTKGESKEMRKYLIDLILSLEEDRTKANKRIVFFKDLLEKL